MTLQAYRAFIASRAVSAKRDGFEPRKNNEYAKQADKNLKEAEASVGDLFGAVA